MLTNSWTELRKEALMYKLIYAGRTLLNVYELKFDIFGFV